MIDKVKGTNTFQTWYTPRYASTDYLNAGEMRTILVKAVTEDVSPDAAKVQAPTFMLWGEKDDETPVEFGEQFKKLIKNSQLVISRHQIWFRKRRVRWANTLAQFW